MKPQQRGVSQEALSFIWKLSPVLSEDGWVCYPDGAGAPRALVKYPPPLNQTASLRPAGPVNNIQTSSGVST